MSPKFLASLTLGLLVALPSHAAKIVGLVPSWHDASQTYFTVGAKRDDGKVLIWTPSSSGGSAFGQAVLGQTCSDAVGGSSTGCAWKVFAGSTSVLQNGQPLSEARAFVDGAVLGSGIYSAAISSSADARIVYSGGSTKTPGAKNQYIVYLAGGRVYAQKYGASISGFTTIVPSGDSQELDLSALNAVGPIKDVVVSGYNSVVEGVYALTTAGDIYFYGNSPTYIRASGSDSGKTGSAATTPQKLVSGASAIFVSRAGEAVASANSKIGYVDASGKPWVAQTTGGYSSPAELGTVSRVFSAVPIIGNNASSVLLSTTGVWADMGYGGSKQVQNGSAVTITSGTSRFQQIQGISASDVVDLQFIPLGASGVTALAVRTDGVMVAFGSAFSTVLATGTMAATPVPLTDPSWKPSVTSALDAVAGAVRLAITPPAGATSLNVYRAIDATARPEFVASIAGNSTTFDDARSDAAVYFYSVSAIQSDGKESLPSTLVQGRANQAPSSVVGTLTVGNGGTSTAVMSVVDPNPSDSAFTFSIVGQPQHGTARINAQGAVEYVSTDLAFAGADTFLVAAKDPKGNVTNGTVTATVTCAAPTLSGQRQPTITEFGKGNVAVSYAAPACQSGLAAKFELIDPTTAQPIVAQTASNISTGASTDLLFEVRELPAKTYPARLTFSGPAIATPLTVALGPVTVATLSAPAMTVPKTTFAEDEQATFTLQMPADTNCPGTTDAALAESTQALCLLEVTSAPAGLAVQTGTNQIVVSGFATPALNTSLAWRASKWGADGVKRTVAASSATLSFVEAPVPTFDIVADKYTAQEMKETVALQIKQTTGYECPHLTDPDAISAALSQGKRACTWKIELPTGGDWFESSPGSRQFVGRFRAGSAGTASVSYTLTRHFAGAPDKVIASGNTNLTVTAAASMFTFGLSGQSGTLVRGFEAAAGKVTQTTGDTCALTSDLAAAKASWFIPGLPLCFVSWSGLPTGVVATGGNLSGIATATGAFDISAAVQVLGPDGSTQWTSPTLTQHVDVAPPAAPAFHVDGTQLKDGVYAVATDGSGVVGRAVLDDDSKLFGRMALQVDVGGTAPTVAQNLASKGSALAIVLPQVPTLWSPVPVRVTSRWQAVGDVQRAVDLTAVLVPPTNVTVSVSNEPIVASTSSVGFDVAVAANSVFDASRMGQWDVWLAAQQADGSLVRLAEPVEAAAGRAHLTVPAASALKGLTVVAVADLRSQLDGYSRRLVTPPAKISVVDGGGIVPLIRVAQTSGKAPLGLAVTSELPTDRLALVGRWQWQVSADAGANWGDVPNAVAATATLALNKPGAYLVRAMTINKFSGQAGFSEATAVRVFGVPQLDVQGARFAGVGTEIKLTAATDAPSVRWRLTRSDGTTSVVAGADLSQTSPVEGVVDFIAEASFETDAGLLQDPLAWSQVVGKLTWSSMEPPKFTLQTQGPAGFALMSDDGTFGVVLLNDASRPTAQVRLWPGAANELVIGPMRNGQRATLSLAQRPAVWSEVAVPVRVEWTDIPAGADQTLRVVATPPSSLRAKITVPSTVLSTDALRAIVEFGEPKSTGSVLDETRHGKWSGYLASQEADGSLRALSDPTPIRESAATLTVPAGLAPGARRIVFVARADAPQADLVFEIASPGVAIQVLDGGKVASTLRMDRTSGPVPLQLAVAADLDPARALAAGTIEFQVSDDGETWKTASSATRLASTIKIPAAGRWLVRAGVFNKYSRAVEFSAPVTVNAYSAINAAIDAEKIVGVGRSTTLRAVAPRASALRWSVKFADGQMQEGQGAEFVVSTSVTQTLQVQLLALAAGADPADAAAWSKASAEVRVIDFMPPSVSLSGEKISDGVYAIDVEGVIARARVDGDAYGLVTATEVADKLAPRTMERMPKGATWALKAPAGTHELWDRIDAAWDVRWSVLPSIAELTRRIAVTGIVVPSERIEIEATPKGAAIAGRPAQFEVRVGLRSGQTWALDAAKVGAWKVWLAASKADGTIVDLTSPNPTSGEVVTLQFDGAEKLADAQLVAVAELQSPVAGYARRLQSRPMKLRVLDGSALHVALSVPKSSGVAPLRAQVRATVDHAELVAKLGWEKSYDGAAWVAAGSGGAITATIKEPGVLLLRAVAKHRNTGELVASEPLRLRAWTPANLSVEGSGFAATGRAVALQAKGSLAQVRWSVRDQEGNDLASGTTAQVDFVPERAAPLTVEFAALGDAEGAADPEAWERKSVRVDVGTVTAPRVQIIGPSTLEEGTVGHYEAQLRADWIEKKAALVVRSGWMLPDGRQVVGHALDWQPSADDFASGAVPVFTAAVEGMEAATAVSVSPRVRITRYTWPSWSLEAPKVVEAPALVRLSVLGDKASIENLRQNFRAPIAFVWSLPDNAEAAKAAANSATFTASAPGAYAVTATVSDDRGNIKTLTQEVLAIPPSPWRSELQVLPGNKYWRAPLELVVRPTFVGGHPQERVLGWKVFAGEELLAEATGTSTRISIASPGDLSLRVVAKTSFGREIEASKTMSIVPNTPPRCHLTVIPGRTVQAVRAACSDADGLLKRMSWSVDGTAVSTAGTMLGGLKSGQAVTLEATDDAGGTTSASVTIP